MTDDEQSRNVRDVMADLAKAREAKQDRSNARGIGGVAQAMATRAADRKRKAQHRRNAGWTGGDDAA